jgi:hypothetical protein
LSSKFFLSSVLKNEVRSHSSSASTAVAFFFFRLGFFFFPLLLSAPALLDPAFLQYGRRLLEPMALDVPRQGVQDRDGEGSEKQKQASKQEEVDGHRLPVPLAFSSFPLPLERLLLLLAFFSCSACRRAKRVPL